MSARKTIKYGGDVVIFLPNKTIKSKNLIIHKKNVGREKNTYGGDVVMFLLNKIIKNKKLIIHKNNVGCAHGFKTMCKAS